VASNGDLPLPLVADLSPVSATSFSQQQLAKTEPNRLSSQSQSQRYVTTDGQSTNLPWCQATTGPKTRFLLLIDSCEFLHVECLLCRQNGSVVYNCCWSSPAQSYLPRSKSVEHVIYIYNLYVGILLNQCQESGCLRTPTSYSFTCNSYICAQYILGLA
jgi:hypothetical protein